MRQCRMMGRWVVAAVLCFLLWPRSSYACSCVDVATEEQRSATFRRQYDDAVAVFVGRVIKSDGYGISFVVNEVWKGDLRERADLQRSSRPSRPDLVVVTSCDYLFDSTKTYLVFAYGTTSAMWAQKCTPTSELADAPEALARL